MTRCANAVDTARAGSRRSFRAAAIAAALSTVIGAKSRAASTIAFQGFEGTTSDTWGFSNSQSTSGTGGSSGASSDAGAGDTVPNQRILTGANSFQIIGASNTIISTNTFNAIDTTGYTGLTLSVRLSSPELASNSGVDSTDTLALKVALNGAAFGPADISLNGNNNSHWGYTAAPGATTAAGTSISKTANGSSDATNYSTFVVNIPDGTTSVAAQIVGTLVGSTFESWCYDNVTLTGISASARNLRWNTTSGAWDTSSGNQPWTDLATSSDSAFTNGDNVDLNNIASNSTISVNAGGVSPGSTTIDNAANTYTFDSGPINGSGAVTKSGSGGAVFKVANGYSGGTNISAGVLETQVSGALGSGVITVSGGTWKTSTNPQSYSNIVTFTGAATLDASTDTQLNGAFSAAADFTKAGSGKLTIASQPTFTGNVAISAGTLVLGQSGGSSVVDAIKASSSGGTWGGNLEITNALRLNLQGGTFSGGGSIRVMASGTSLTNTGSGITNIINNDIVLNPTNALSFVANIFPTSSGNWTIGGNIQGNANVNFAGGNSGTGVSGGSGTITLTAQSHYTGSTFINATASGTIKIGTGDALPTTTDVRFGSNASGTGTLDLNGNSQQIGSLSGVSTARITNNGSSDSVLTVSGSNTPSSAFAGAISNGASNKISLVKSGSSSLVLDGANTYTGVTTISAGSVIVGSTVGSSGAIGNGAVSVNSAATLGGHGIVGGAVTVHSGTISPGSSAVRGGTLTLSNGLDLSDGGQYAWELADFNQPGSSDQIRITGGNLILGGTNSLSVAFVGTATDPSAANAFWNSSHVWKILDWTSAGSNSHTGALNFTPATYTTGAFTLAPGGGTDDGDYLLAWTPSGAGPRSLFWDGNDAGSPDPSDLGGTWDTSNSHWFDGSNHIHFDSTRPDIANFGAGGGNAGSTMIVVAGSVTASEVHFLANSNNYVLTSGVIHVSGFSANGITASNSAEIGSALVFDSSRNVSVDSGIGLTFSGIVSGSGFAKVGAGTLRLTNTFNAFAGLTIRAGTLAATSDAALGSGAITFDGGTLRADADINSSTRAVVINNPANGTIDSNNHNVTLGGVVSGNGVLNKIGVGILSLTNSANSFAGVNVAGAGSLVAVSNDGQLGAPGAAASFGNGGGTLLLADGFTSPRPFAIVNGGTGGNIEVDGSDVASFAGQLSGNARFSKFGAGTLVLNPTSIIGTPRVNTSDNFIAQGTLRIDATDNTTFASSLGLGPITIQNGGTLQLNNVQLGDPNTTAGNPIVLQSGGKLQGTGHASIFRSSSSPKVPTNGTFITLSSGPLSTDRLEVGSAIRNDTSGVTNSSTVIHVTGGGVVYLASGPTSTTSLTADHFTGLWSVDSGILQVGPLVGSSGDALNALGYNYGPDDMNAATGPNGGACPVTLTAGTLAAGVDQSVGDFRNAIILSGGALSATAGANPAFSGNLILAIGQTSTIRLADAEDTSPTPAARNITLVNNPYQFGNLTWASNTTLNVTGSGMLTFNRASGSVGVQSNATLHIASGAAVVLDGLQDALSNGTHFVNVINDSTAGTNGGLLIKSNTKNAGAISGAGKTSVAAGATLIASSIRQNTLTLHGDAQIRPDGTAAAVSTLANLTIDAGHRLDLTNNKLIVTAIAAGTWNNGAYDGISGMVQTGRANGAWTGAGLITSESSAKSASGFLTTLAVASAGDVKHLTATQTASWAGQTVHATDALAMYTYNGDANLDGKVNADDYFQIDSNYNKSGTSFGYYKGDFNYDGQINGDDYFAIDYSFHNQGAAFSAAAPIGEGLAGVSAVPEPTGLGLIALAAITVGARRKRRPATI